MSRHTALGRRLAGAACRSCLLLMLTLLIMSACAPDADQPAAIAPPATADATTPATESSTAADITTATDVAATPTATPPAAEPLTMKQAFALLCEQADMPNLAFFAYRAFDMDGQGLSAHYTVSGYSAADQRFCYLSVSKTGEFKLKCRDQESVDDPVVTNLDTLKDSPELVQDAAAKYAPCPGGFSLVVNLTQSSAQFLCGADNWSGEVSPYR